MKHVADEEVYKYEMELPLADFETLKEIGLARIQTDEQALVEYAIISLLEDEVKHIDIDTDIETNIEEE